MKKRDIITIILAITTASSIGYGINGNVKAKDLIEKAEQLKEQIETKNIELEDLNEQIEVLSQSVEDRELAISGLKTELETRLKELELARQRIARINAKVSFNHMNVLELSGVTEVHMRRALEGTGLEDVADAFVAVEEEFGVNAFLVAAIAAQESAWGTSERSIYQNNLTGHAVYNSNAKGTYFETRSESVMNTGELLKNEYLTPGGHSFNGYSVEAINERYCFEEDGVTVDYDWCRNVISIAYDLKNKANNF